MFFSMKTTYTSRIILFMAGLALLNSCNKTLGVELEKVPSSKGSNAVHCLPPLALIIQRRLPLPE